MALPKLKPIEDRDPCSTAEQCFAVWNPRLGIYYGSISDAQECAIADHVSVFGDWETCKKSGDMAVKINITIDEI